MKQIFTLLLAGVLFWGTGCQNSADASAVNRDSLNAAAMKDTANYTSIQWIDSIEQNLGKVKEGQIVEINWRFKNSGNKPLIIEKVEPGCGCTAADPPKEPIAPGKEGVITAKFDSHNRQGVNHKDVYVRANNSNKDGNSLRFIVEVTKD